MEVKKSQAKKVQTLVNVRAMFSKLLGVEHWINSKLVAFKLEDDRCYLNCDDVDNVVMQLSQSDKFYSDNNVSHHGETAEYGWRSYTSPSLHVILHQHNEVEFFEMDVDRYGTYDLVNIFGHTAGLFYHRFFKKKTNPFRIAKVLKKKGYKINTVRE